MDKNLIINKIKENFTGQVISVNPDTEIPTLVIDKDAVYDIISFLKDEMSYHFLTSLFGIHYPEQELQLGVIYILHNMEENDRICLKAFASLDKPEFKSCVPIFSGANWMERETYDFYGIIFKNHPNLKRILNVEYLDYFPMRKEYPLEDQTRTDKDDKFFGR